MRAAKAKIKVSPWSGIVGAKAELEQAWFRVRGIPYDKRSIPTLAYVGSLVVATVEIDEESMHRADFVRIKIADKEVAKVPEIVEGATIPFLYDFYYERELELGNARNKTTGRVSAGNESGPQPSPKKPRTDNAPIVASSSQVVPFNKTSGVDLTKSTQGHSVSCGVPCGSLSAPVKGTKKSDAESVGRKQNGSEQGKSDNGKNVTAMVNMAQEVLSLQKEMINDPQSAPGNTLGGLSSGEKSCEQSGKKPSNIVMGAKNNTQMEWSLSEVFSSSQSNSKNMVEDVGLRSVMHQKEEDKDLALLNSDEDRVQRLSGIEITESEEDPMSQELQQSQSDKPMAGLMKSSDLVLNKVEIQSVPIVQGSLQANPHDGEVKTLLMNEEDGVENSLIMEPDSLAASKTPEYVEGEFTEANSKERRVRVSLGQIPKNAGMGKEDNAK
jgi:hypothetical protein